MKDLQVTSKKTMTTKELAEVLNVSTDSIQNTVKKLGENFRQDLTVLCNECHETFHNDGGING